MFANQEAKQDWMKLNDGRKWVIVCGGRNYSNGEFVNSVLDKLYKTGEFEALASGGAYGADELSADWAFNKGIPSAMYPANWGKYGRAAGPIRNAQMLYELEPVLIVAFPGGRGTEDMCRKAKSAGVSVKKYKEERKRKCHMKM